MQETELMTFPLRSVLLRQGSWETGEGGCYKPHKEFKLGGVQQGRTFMEKLQKLYYCIIGN